MSIRFSANEIFEMAGLIEMKGKGLWKRRSKRYR